MDKAQMIKRKNGPDKLKSFAVKDKRDATALSPAASLYAV